MNRHALSYLKRFQITRLKLRPFVSFSRIKIGDRFIIREVHQAPIPAALCTWQRHAPCHRFEKAMHDLNVHPPHIVLAEKVTLNLVVRFLLSDDSCSVSFLRRVWAVQQDGCCQFAITSGSSCFLSIGFEVARGSPMQYNTNIGFVNAHAKPFCRHHNVTQTLNIRVLLKFSSPAAQVTVRFLFDGMAISSRGLLQIDISLRGISIIKFGVIDGHPALKLPFEKGSK